ncbi:MAG: ysxE [Bacillales bacterium]|jgi:spore coat protein YsxE|nr:ysxE [Bacillales bacterium]
MEDLEVVKKVLSLYHIQARYIEKIGKVYKVFTPYGNYALKKYNQNSRNPNDLIQTVSHLYVKGFQSIAPIFRAFRGEFLVDDESGTYYLMPWYEEGHNIDAPNRYEQMFRQLAQLHNKTVENKSVNETEVDSYLAPFRKNLEVIDETLSEFLNHCESKIYMSPSQLQFCSIYNKTKQAVDFSNDRIDKWESWMKDAEESRVVLNHGDLSLKHYVVDRVGHGYFINFEKSTIASPVNDLVYVTRQVVNDLPIYNDTKWTWLNNYFSNFKWSKGERHLYLANISTPFLLYNYTQDLRSRSNTELESIKTLQNIYWQMVNSEYIVSKILEIERNEEMEELESSEN